MLNYYDYLKKILLTINYSKIILRENDKTYTGGELFKKSSELACFFASRGAKPGDRIAIQLPNSLEFILCFFAGIFGKFTLIPINASLPKRDIDYILEVTQPKLVIKNFSDLQFIKPDQQPEVQRDKNTIIAIVFTSGTTNRPKGVCHVAERMFGNALAFNELVGLDENTCMLHVMPMGYQAGFLNTLLCPILAKGSVVLAPQFSSAEAINFWKVAIEYNINAMWLSPTMASLLARINRSEIISEWTRKNLHHIFIGTAPLPLPIKENFENVFGVECFESYGMTELMLVSSNTRNFPRKKTSVGRLLSTVTVQVRDDKNNLLSYGQRGNIYINTSFAFEGYLDAATGSILTKEDEWVDTGDNGYLDENNNLFITGRTKDLIIHGGTNISPRAIEEVLLQHPEIMDAVVIGKPHPFWGEEIIAFLMIKENTNLTSAMLTQYCQDKLQSDAIPSQFEIVQEFPRASTGKVQTNKLRELL